MSRYICLLLALLVCLPVLAQEKQEKKQEKEEIPHIFEHPEWKYHNTMEEKIATKIQDIEKMPTYHEGRAGAISGAGELIWNYRKQIRQDIINWAMDEIIKYFGQDYYYEVRNKCPEALERIVDEKTTANLIKHSANEWKKIKNNKEEQEKNPWKEDPEKVKKDIKAQVEKARKAQALIAAVQSDKWSIVRAMATESLSKIGNKSCIPVLRKALENDPYSTVRAAAAKALTRFDDKQSLPLFKKGLNDGWSNVRLACIQALAKFGTKDVLKPLIGRLSDKKVNVREKAALALGKIGDASVLTALEKASSDKDDLVRESVYKAISEIGKRFESISKKSSDILADKGLKETIPNPKMMAIQGLLRLKDKRGIEALVETLKHKYPYWQRDAVNLGLQEKVKDPSFLKGLEDLIGSDKTDPNVKEDAKKAYDELTSKSDDKKSLIKSPPLELPEKSNKVDGE
jgi:HEAT repeat protein